MSIQVEVEWCGSGPVTADRVRDVLGLIPDDVYGELLRVVAERDSAGVFSLVERLVDGGAGLGGVRRGAGGGVGAGPFAELRGGGGGGHGGRAGPGAEGRAPLPAPR